MLDIAEAKPDDIDPKLEAAQRDLAMELAHYRRNNPAINARTIKAMNRIVEEFRWTCKRRGIIFPKQTIIAFVKMDHIAVWPAELPMEEIQKRLRMLIIMRQRQNEFIDAEDMAIGIRRAYPDYSPSTHTINIPVK